MNEQTKKAGLIAVIVIALLVAGFGASKALGGDQMIVEKKVSMPAGFKSEKEQALEAQQGGAAPAPKEERDLGG
jgi:hypothetical protein